MRSTRANTLTTLVTVSMGVGAMVVAERAMAEPVVELSTVPPQKMIADGRTEYQLKVKANTTVPIHSADWRVYGPSFFEYTSSGLPLEENDFFDVEMSPDWNFVKGIGELSTRNTASSSLGSLGYGEIGVIGFKVRGEAPLGVVEGVEGGGWPDNFDLYDINFVDTFGVRHTFGNGGVSINSHPYEIISPADLDQDGDVDLTDFGKFAQCFNGPNRAYTVSGCEQADMNFDGDVDLEDFAKFSQAFNGPNRTPNQIEW